MNELDPEDLDVTTGCKAVHPDRMGGQHVAKSCVGVRITHKPTGTSVLSQDERSQHANRIKALEALRTILFGTMHES